MGQRVERLSLKTVEYLVKYHQPFFARGHGVHHRVEVNRTAGCRPRLTMTSVERNRIALGDVFATGRGRPAI